MLDTLRYIRHETDTWLEITTLLIPGPERLRRTSCTRWRAGSPSELGPDVPLHFSAFHPDFKMRDIPSTPPETLTRARRIAIDDGLRYVYTGNVHDREGDTTLCPSCGAAVVERDWYALKAWHLTGDGHCRACGSQVAGVLRRAARRVGARRVPVRAARAGRARRR